ncbi:hypothetical protein GCM10025875_34500 [Litorihabitans aurantiacus]|uniref:Phosphotransferase n=1 Tax=Litorihabitans aurantiacus TaxID=1930061 RepID=A0AA38CSE7_9MICO|nr:hypothetical protein GCM10025875_34500 [Litorihabitans aurantiacus]
MPDAAAHARARRTLARLLPALLLGPPSRTAARPPAHAARPAPLPPSPSSSPSSSSTCGVPPDHVVVDGVAHEVLRGWPRGPGRALLELAAADGSRRGAEVQLDDGAARVTVHPRGVDARLPALADRLALGEKVVVHRPGRRAVLRGSGPDAPFVKVTRRGRAADAARRHHALAGLLDGAARTPRLLWSTDDALATAPLPGLTLLALGRDETADEEALAAAWSGVGRVLATLAAHGTVGGEAEGTDGTGPAPHPGTPALLELPGHDAAAEHATTLAWLDPVRAWGLLPAVGDDVVRDALAPLLTDPPGPRGVLHRDLHEAQVLVAPDGGLGLLDLDTLARGESALDLANLLAHLDLRERQGLLTPRRRARAEEALLGAAAPAPGTLARVPAHLVAARLRLAGVYAMRPRWRTTAVGLLRAALASA